MVPAPALLSSGVAAVDARWGGLGAGATYALVGRADGGRLTLALHAVRAAVDARARCLVISPRETTALVAAGHSVGLDLAAAHGDGRLRLLRLPDAETLAARGDAGMASAYADLARLVETDRPDRVVVEDFTPLVQFETFAHFEEAFGRLVATLHGLDATLVVGLGEPANEASRRLLASVQTHAAGTIEIVGDGADRRLVLHDAPPPAALPVGALGAEPDAETPGTSAVPAMEPPDASFDEAPAEEPFSAEPPSAPSDPLPLHAGDGVPMTAITAPPPSDPSLSHAVSDPFGHDTAAFLAQGFLVDSGAGAVVGHVPVAPPDSPAAPAPAGPPAPGWAPLGDASPAQPDERARFVAGLDAAYAARAPFDAVAVRMEPGTAPALQFETVVGGLRAALTPADDLYVDATRCRAVVRLAGADRAATLFASVQAHVRARLGPDAAAVLAAVAAAPIPGGAPFTDGASLLTYVVDQ